MNDINRRFFSPEQKVAILREHLVEGRAVSDLCEKHRIHPNDIQVGVDDFAMVPGVFLSTPGSGEGFT